jgi:hypothetical protein
VAAIVVLTIFAAFLALTFVAWRHYLWAAEKLPQPAYSLTDVFGDRHLVNVPHQTGVRWPRPGTPRAIRTRGAATLTRRPHRPRFPFVAQT